MPNWLSKNEMQRVVPAEQGMAALPLPTRVVSNGEFNPLPQTERQRRVEARTIELADAYAGKLGLSRREFLKTASGMAAAFLAMNQVYGSLFDVREAEAADLDAATERAAALSSQFVLDDQVHFVRDDYEHQVPLDLGRYAAEHWNPSMLDDLNIEHYRFKFENFLKEVFLDSDTKVALLSGAPFDDAEAWFLSNDQMARVRELINRIAGGRRLLCHAVFTPGTDGWLDEVERAIAELRPDSWKGYTVGDPLFASKYPWRLDDEELVYPFYERIQKAGIRTICIHKGLLPNDYEESFRGIWQNATVDDVGKAAKDWPQLNFVIYHSALRPFLELPDAEAREFEETGNIQWVSDLAAIPERYGVTNVYGELGTCLANTAVTHPRLCAGLVGTLIQGLGVERVLWGTDSVWYGSPQWQIEALRRLEVPEDLQERRGFAPLGAADGPVKRAILGGNAARLYELDVEAASSALAEDALESIKSEYRASGIGRSNLAYGFVHRPGA
jgi:predicted TIM-barrel fold metal-dependent hydrolase